MYKFFIIFLVSTIFQVSANDHRFKSYFYQPDFKIVSFEDVCPKQPNGLSCMMIGSKITIDITLKGCVDKLAFLGVEGANNYNANEIKIMALAKYDKRNAVVRCFGPRIVRKTFIYQGTNPDINIVKFEFRR